MELNKNQLVVFTDVDGSQFTEGYLEVRWSDKFNSFYSFTRTDAEDERTGKPVKLFSTTIIEKKKRTYKKQEDISKMKEIEVAFETEKAYAVFDGTNGAVCRCNTKVFYKFYAKSICIEKDGKIYAPMWA